MYILHVTIYPHEFCIVYIVNIIMIYNLIYVWFHNEFTCFGKIALGWSDADEFNMTKLRFDKSCSKKHRGFSHWKMTTLVINLWNFWSAYIYIWWYPQMDGLIILENPILMDDLGVPPFMETSIYMYICIIYIVYI